MAQKKFSFDNETLKKIGKGFLLGLASALSAGGMCYATTGDLNKALIVAMSAFAGSIINVPIEYAKGDKEVGDMQ